jgi:predicted GH43/DUF377 family glycosyl hydrolase
MLAARRGAWWDANKIGLSSPPIETEQGWLVIYHGVRQTAAGSLYRVGLALFDKDDPATCLRRGDEWIFNAVEGYELKGDVGNVVFPCGTTLAPDGDTLRIYYGGADSCVGLATASLKEMLEWLEVHGQISGRRSTDVAPAGYASQDSPVFSNERRDVSVKPVAARPKRRSPKKPGKK